MVTAVASPAVSPSAAVGAAVVGSEARPAIPLSVATTSSTSPSIVIVTLAKVLLLVARFYAVLPVFNII